MLVEIQAFDRVAVHHDIAATVDALLRGFEGEAEVRTLGATGEIASVERVTVQERPDAVAAGRGPASGGSRAGREPGERPRRTVGTTTSSEGPAAAGAAGGPQRRIMPFGISRSRLEEAIPRPAPTPPWSTAFATPTRF